MIYEDGEQEINYKDAEKEINYKDGEQKSIMIVLCYGLR